MNMFMLTPPSPSRTKVAQQCVNELSPKSRFTEESHSGRLHFDAERLPVLHGDPSSRPMATPHRGLEHGLPPGMILPDPLRQPQPQHSAHNSISNPPPPPPQSYEPQEDRAGPWHAQPKFEEEKRKQEEERRRQEELRVRQEELRLDQRKTEERMLRESISSGIHPNLVPLIFVGLGGGNVAGSGFEMAQQYIRQFQQVGQQVQTTLQSTSPDIRRDLRAVGSAQYGVIQQQPSQYPPHGGAPTVQGQPPGSTSQHAANVYPSPAYQSPQSHSRSLISGSNAFTSPAATAHPTHSQGPLPRLTTNEAQVQYASVPTLPVHSQAQGSNSTPGKNQDQSSSSPSIYFHHWQPPAATSNSTPSGKDSTKVSPKNVSQTNSADPSPKKRKAQDAHQAAPPPTSAPPRAPSRSSSTSSRLAERRQSASNAKTPTDLTDQTDTRRPRSKSVEAKTAFATKTSPEDSSSNEVQAQKTVESVSDS